MHQLATTFDEHVQVMAIESPHGLILDWWSRLELANEYFQVYGLTLRRPVPSENQAMENDPRLGPDRRCVKKTDGPLRTFAHLQDGNPSIRLLRSLLGIIGYHGGAAVVDL